jgi:hypothetical protein
MARKHSAVVALGSRKPLKDGPTAKKTTARNLPANPSVISPDDTSDKALATLLKRLKATTDPDEIRQLSEQLERIVFHQQFTNA